MTLRCYGNKEVVLSPIKNEQQVSELIAILLPCKIVVIKLFTLEDQTQMPGMCSTQLTQKGNRNRICKIYNMDEVHSVSTKNDPSLSDFCILMSLYHGSCLLREIKVGK